MQVHQATASSSRETKLVVLALILFSFSIFLPWVSESYVYYGWGFDGPFLKGYSMFFWSFMRAHDGKTVVFEKFWFQGQTSDISQYLPSLGLYFGWMLIFALQIVTLVYSLMYFLNWQVSEKLREKHSTWLVILPLSTILLALYQLVVQNEIVYETLMPMHGAFPNVGFLLAVLSLAFLLVAIRVAPEQSQLKNISKTLKNSFKRRWPAIVLLSFAAFFFIPELQFQTSVTKVMVVEKRENFEEIYENPELWAPHLSRIMSVGNVFRARLIDSNSKYAYCRLLVPVISYRMLQTVLNIMGYVVREPTFMHLLSKI